MNWKCLSPVISRIFSCEMNCSLFAYKSPPFACVASSVDAKFIDSEFPSGSAYSIHRARGCTRQCWKHRTRGENVFACECARRRCRCGRNCLRGDVSECYECYRLDANAPRTTNTTSTNCTTGTTDTTNTAIPCSWAGHCGANVESRAGGQRTRPISQVDCVVSDAYAGEVAFAGSFRGW